MPCKHLWEGDLAKELDPHLQRPERGIPLFVETYEGFVRARNGVSVDANISDLKVLKLRILVGV